MITASQYRWYENFWEQAPQPGKNILCDKVTQHQKKLMRDVLEVHCCVITTTLVVKAICIYYLMDSVGQESRLRECIIS